MVQFYQIDKIKKQVNKPDSVFFSKNPYHLSSFKITFKIYLSTP